MEYIWLEYFDIIAETNLELSTKTWYKYLKDKAYAFKSELTELSVFLITENSFADLFFKLVLTKKRRNFNKIFITRKIYTILSETFENRLI